MLAKMIDGMTRNLGAPMGWEHERGRCGHLPIRDIQTTQGPAMESVWEPTPGERDRIARGGLVLLGVMGDVHPPVYMRTDRAPETTTEEGSSLDPTTEWECLVAIRTHAGDLVERLNRLHGGICDSEVARIEHYIKHLERLRLEAMGTPGIPPG